MSLAVQDHWTVDVSHRHAVVPWTLEYATYWLNRYEVGRDGRTAYERLKAKKAEPLGMEFGEFVQWRTRRVGGGTLQKLDSVWDHCVFFGVKGKTREIGVRSGIFKAGIVRRRSPRMSKGREIAHESVPRSFKLVAFSPVLCRQDLLWCIDLGDLCSS